MPAARWRRSTCPSGLPADRLRDALNFHMKPHPVVVLRAAPAPEGWNARFSAQRRGLPLPHPEPPRPPGAGGRPRLARAAPLDAAAMQRAAQSLLGRHDFTCFRAAACQAKSPLRTLDRLDVRRDGDMVEIIAEARSFLHHQVRNMVGTLKLVGTASGPRHGWRRPWRRGIAGPRDLRRRRRGCV